MAAHIAMLVALLGWVASPTSREIDETVWNVLIETVATSDIARMGTMYFPNAVLVHPKGTAPIDKTLERWGQQMAEAKAKGSKAALAFRFRMRQDDATTAFETGIFRYTVTDKAGVSTPIFIPFEILMAKQNGKWRILMERQFEGVTEADWNKLPE
ncbi:MAG: nuclear transport factor 2 family protein [Gemmatimonadales bacterium]